MLEHNQKRKKATDKEEVTEIVTQEEECTKLETVVTISEEIPDEKKKITQES